MWRKVPSGGARCWFSLRLLSAARPRRVPVCGSSPSLGLALRRLDAVRPDDARGPVAVQHEDQLLSFQLQLLDLGFQVRVQRLQSLRFLREDGRKRRR